MLFATINPYIIGTIAGIFTAASLLPQLVKIIREKEADDISLPMLFVLCTGVSLWIWYGFLKEDWAVIITNIFSLLVNSSVLFFSIRYKKR